MSGSNQEAYPSPSELCCQMLLGINITRWFLGLHDIPLCMLHTHFLIYLSAGGRELFPFCVRVIFASAALNMSALMSVTYWWHFQYLYRGGLLAQTAFDFQFFEEPHYCSSQHCQRLDFSGPTRWLLCKKCFTHDLSLTIGYKSHETWWLLDSMV